MIARHHAYVFRTPGNLAQNDANLGVPLQLDTDSYFALRAISYQVMVNGPGLGFRYQDARGRYIEQAITGVSAGLGTEPSSAPGVCTTQWAPVHHQVWYPPGGVIKIDLKNLNQAPGNNGNIRIVFIGTKYFPDNASVFAPNLPPCYQNKPYNYVTPTDIQMTAVSESLNNFLPVVNSDFIFQCAQISYSAAGAFVNATDLGIRLKDYQGKYYDNDYIPIELLFGQHQADRPGILWPEIYVDQDQGLYFDLQRNDPATEACSLQIRFGGMQIYDKTPARARA